MKRKFTFLLMVLLALTGFKSWGQTTEVQIGNGTEQSNIYPFTSLYNYSYSEILYTATEILNAGGGAGSINSISFYALPESKSNTYSFNIYMRSVTRNSYTGAESDWETVSAEDVVGSGSVTSGESGWLTFNLTTPFQWDGTSNLLIALDNNSGVWGGKFFYRFGDDGNPYYAHVVYTDNFDIDPYDVPTSNLGWSCYHSTDKFRPNIKLTIEPSASCPAPTGLTASNITGSGATITWSGSTDSYKVVYGTAEGFNPDDITPVAVSETTYTINNLTTDVTYSIAVKAVCGAGEESDWSQYSFTPTCPTITYFYYGDKTATTATLYWGVEGNTDSYALAYGASSSFDLDNPETYTVVNGVTTTNYQLQNLTTGTTYKCAVKAACGDAGYGNWSSEITFTPSCPAPYYIDIPIVTPTTVTLRWSGEYYVEGYTLAYGLASDFDLENPGTYTSVPVEPGEWNTEYEITDLTPNVAYKCAVRSSCDGESQGEWSYPTQFTPRLEAPESLSISNIMATSVTASWNASDGAANYTVAYGLANGFNLDDPTTYQTMEPTSATSVEINGLTAEQNYACAVKASAGDISSEWSYPAYFVPTAKQTLVANDGTNTSYCHAPFYGGGITMGESSSQFIIPASELLQMRGSSVMGFDFPQYNVYSHECGNWEIYLKEVDNTTFTSDSFIEDNTMQLVYSGELVISSNTLSITFQNSFDYEEGNLLVYFKQTQNATSWDIYTPWYGVETSGNTSVGYYNYNDQNYIQRFGFLPKTTITYIPIEKFAITLVQPEDEDEVGTIASDMAEAAEGKTVTLSFNPKQYDDHSYKISSWNVTKTGDATVTVEVADNNTFVMPAYPVTVSADIETVAYYALTVDEGIEGGSIEAYPAEHIEFGQQVELNASPAQHYKFVEWNITKVPSGDAFPVPALPNTTFNMPASALNVSATFEAYLPHTITLPEPVEEGYVTASQTEGLYCYDNVTLTVHPSEHCSLQSIAIMTGETPVSYTQDGNDYYFSMPDGDVTVTATFVENSKYAVTLVYNEQGGSVTLQDASPETEYYAGDRVNLSVAANTGYILYSLEAEDSEHNPVTITNNQFVMPESAVTVTAVFVHGIIVNDGNNTNGYVPINGYNADAYTKSQFIIPESSLVDMKNGKIESMAFYLSDPSDSHTFTGNWKVYIKNVVNATTLSNYETLSAEEKVYEGGIAITNGKMTVNIPEDNQYEYRGGNLLIGFEQTQMGNWHTTTWLGVNKSSNTAYAGYTGQYGDEHHSAYQFLPKVTFLYEPGEPLPEYDITFHSNGIVSEQTITEGLSLPNPTNIPVGLTFEGWAAEDIETYYNEEQAEQIEYVTAARAEEDLYAVFSYSETETTSKGAGTWIKVTDVNELADNDKVVFVYGNYIMCQRYSGYYNYSVESVYIENGVITNISDNAIEFTLVENGDNWKLQYSDNAETPNIGETTLAYTGYDLAPHNFYSYTYPDTWTAVNNANAVNFKETDCEYTRYIAYNSSQSQIKGNSNNPCQVYKASSPVVTHYYYMTEVLTHGNIAANTTAKNIIITTGTVTVDNDIVLTMAENGLFRNENAAKFVFEDGAQLITNNTGVIATFKKHINGNNWYTISSPLANSVEFANVTNLIPTTVEATNYDLYRLNEAEGIWENSRIEDQSQNEFTTIDKGLGYIYANNAGADHIAFAGEVNVAPAVCTLTNSATNGFNLIGNPFMQNIELANVTGVTLADGFYVLSNEGDWGAKLIDKDIKPLQGFLVQATTAGQATISKHIANKGERSGHNTNIEMIVSNSNHRDNAFAVFGEGTGLNKVNHRNTEAPMLYVPQDGEKFAIAFMDENTTVFPLNFKAMTTGKYSISLKATDDISTLVLIDNMTGVETNMLLEESYSFNGSPADSDGRFTVKLSISHSNGQSDNEHFVYQNGKELVVNGEGSLQIFDVLGRVVISEEVHGQTVYVGNLSEGAYIVRMTGNEVKTQKIIIR